MALQEIHIEPGIFSELTPLTAKNKWVDGSLVRFYLGQAQQIGGYLPYNTTLPVLDGIARSMLGWVANDGTPILAIGTNRHLYVVMNGVLNDITPYRIGTRPLEDNPFTTQNTMTTVVVFSPVHGLTTGMLVQFNSSYVVNGADIPGTVLSITVVDQNDFSITATTPATSSGTGGGSSVSYNTILPNNPFSTVIATNVVTVSLPSHGVSVNDIVYFPGTTIVNGITINGQYNINTVPTSGTFTITGNALASGTGSGGGSDVVYDFLIPTGAQSQFGVLGWSDGVWSGPEGWSTPPGGSSTGVPVQSWFLNNFGQDLIAQVNGGPIYYWTESNGPSTVAQIIYQAPLVNGFTLVDNSQFLISYGSSTPGLFSGYEPKLEQWSDEGNPFLWTPNQTNAAGGEIVGTGSVLMSVVQMQQNKLVLTDTDATWQTPTTEAQPAFGFQYLSSGCGAISNRAAANLNGIAYWMSSSAFYQCQTAPNNISTNSIRNQVFENLNFAQASKIYAATISEWNEIRWFYPSAGSDEIDSYAGYDVVQNLWSFGAANGLVRTTWIDVSAFSPDYPLAIDQNGYIWTQETNNIVGGTPPGMPSYLTSGYIDISQGQNMGLISRCTLDFEFHPQFDMNPMAQITFYAKPFATSTEVYTKGPFTFGPNTNRIDFYLRGRVIWFTISGLSGFWKIGTLGFDIIPDGLR